MLSYRSFGPSADMCHHATVQDLDPCEVSGILTHWGLAHSRLNDSGSTAGPEDTELPGSLGGTSRTVLADDGVELYVEVDGARDAALTVVFCHGLALHMDCWHRQRLALTDQARLVLYDQRGHGRSGRGAPESATIGQLGRDLYQVLEEVVPSGPVVLVGHSMGGMAIMALAEAHPDLFLDRVVGVALLSTSAGGLDQVTFGLPACGARVLHPFVPGLFRMLNGKSRVLGYGRRAAADLLRMLVRRYSFASDVPPTVLDSAAGMIESTPIEVIGDFYPTLAGHCRFAALAALRDIPTLILVGSDDVVTPVEHSEAIARRLPSADLVVLASTGHGLMLERPRMVNSCLSRLLGRNSGMTTRPELVALEELSVA